MVKQAKSTLGLEYLSIDLAGRALEGALTSAEITGYRSMLGQLLWAGQQSRPDLCVGVSLGIVFPRIVMNFKTCSVICYADAAFANAEGEESQCGLVVGFTHHPRLVKPGRFDPSMITGCRRICCV